MQPKHFPDFLIVGTMKSGTTTLSSLLEKHPEIEIPKKEIHFFDRLYKKNISQYQSYFTDKDPFICGEATPTYSFLPHVPYHIAKTIPDIKIIWIFRDPVHRAYSNYLHSFKKGNEKRSFTKAINDELEGKEFRLFSQYINRSIYVDQVFRYSSYFRNEQMHYIALEDLLQNTNEVMRELTSFLGTKTAFDFPNIDRLNETKIPKHITILQILNSLNFGSQYLGILSQKLFPKTKAPKIDPKNEEFLQLFFKPHNKRLDTLTGNALSAWWS